MSKKQTTLSANQLPWWRHAVIYQVYPRSFMDSNDDGIGDIPGIIEKLDYIASLGVDAIWLSPVYLSPNRDYGYDIADYIKINPEYGTMRDMDRLIREAKKRHIRIIMDLVINHTSDQHKWFQASRNPNSKYHDYYVWRDPSGYKNGQPLPPNNWTSIFTGPAWTFDKRSGQFYLHLFTEHQPDLNYRNENVIQEIEHVLRFWLDKGVAGFRCDVINLLYDESYDDGQPQASGTGAEFFVSTEGTHRVLKRLHLDVLAPYRAYTVGELYSGDLEQAQRFTEGDELDTVFGFDHVKQGAPSGDMMLRLKEGLAKWQLGLDWNTLFVENHDQQRAVSAFGGKNAGRYHDEIAKLLATLMLTMRGTTFVYQGQEIGMTNAPLTFDQMKDPVVKMIYDMIRGYHAPKWLARKIAIGVGRDYARTPMQWNGDDDNAGFSGGEPWLPVNPNYVDISVEQQDNDDTSVLNFYRQMIEIRKSNLVLLDGTIKFNEDKKYILSYVRKYGDRRILIVANLSDRNVRPLTKLSGRIIVNSYAGQTEFDDGILQPYEAVVMELS